jgi:nitroreductase
MLKELVLKNRSYRRFYQDVLIDRGTLLDLIDLARLTPSGRNAQPLKYYLSSDAIHNAILFPHLAWAAYLTEWDGPVEGERPSAYIIVLLDREINPSAGCDHGIATQTILLGAAEKGLGGCIIGSVQRQELAQALNISDRFEILHVIALGKPRETVVIEPMEPQADFKYWRDEKGVHHVPKRSLDELIINP